MTKPQWWERVLAALVDGLVLMIPIILIFVLFGLVGGGNLAVTLIMMLIASIIVTAGVVAYKVMLEAGPRQATLGKMVFGLQVVDAESGQRAPLQQALIRTWPWWLG
ncbi:MAG: RDD family protein, partial [Alphaproteobacteria bacterium]